MSFVAGVSARAMDGHADVIGQMGETRAQEDDTAFDIARRNDLGLLELLEANPGLNVWRPDRDRVLHLPTAHVLPSGRREGIVINLGDLRLYYYRDGQAVLTAPIGIGRDGLSTPIGRTAVKAKFVNPFWYPTRAHRAENPGLPFAVPPGPDNPLGRYALQLEWSRYLIHGTNKPDGIGQLVSRGCVRLYPEDIAQLFALVEVGTPVRVVDEPVKLGWRAGQLFLEAHPSREQINEFAKRHHLTPHPSNEERHRIASWARQQGIPLDMSAVDAALERRDGMPVKIADTPHTLTSF